MSHLIPVDPITGQKIPPEKWDEDTKRKSAILIADTQRGLIAAGRKPDFKAIKFGRSLSAMDFEDMPSDDECDKALKAKG